jgi:phage gp29-like protein
MPESKLVDHLGRPIRSSDLKKPDHSTRTGIVSARQRNSAIIAFQLSAERLGQILRDATVGSATDFLSLAKEMEKRDLHYRAVLSQRKDGVAKILPRVLAASDDPRDVEIKEALERELKRSQFGKMIRNLLDALSKGYAVSEMTWDFSGQFASPRFADRDQRDFRYDPRTLQELRKNDNTPSGTEMTPGKYLVHEPRLVSGTPLEGALAYPVSIYYLIKSFAIKDWAAFAEVFGFPVRVGTYPEGATEDQQDDLLAAVQSIGVDAAAIVHEQMKIHFESAVQGAGGRDLFEGLADFCDLQISKGVVGQTLTTQQGTVGSLALGKTHEHRLEDKVAMDATAIADTVNDQFVRVWYGLNFPTEPDGRRPIVLLEEEERDDIKALMDYVAQAADRGVKISASWVRDKIGAPEPEEGEEVLHPKTGASQPDLDADRPTDVMDGRAF